MVGVLNHQSSIQHGGDKFDLDKIWTDLKSGIKQIFARDSMEMKRYMELYTNVYNYCTAIQNNENGTKLQVNMI